MPSELAREAESSLLLARSEPFKAKVCMAGEPAVGKTSLIRRFVIGDYDDRYIVTLGTKVSKRAVHLADPVTSEETEVDLILWDVMGTPSIRDLLKEAYYRGAKGILAVVDLTRYDTLAALDGWAASIRTVAGRIPIHVVANKVDVVENRRVAESDLAQFCASRGWPWSYASAKTGAGVIAAFDAIARSLLARRASGQDPAHLAQ